jgi:class 3 adenylate cyclase
MLVLPLLDLGVTGIFILITQRYSVITQAASGLLALALATVCAGIFLYKPIFDFEKTGNNPDIAAARLQRLPWLTAIAAFILTLIYCFPTFTLGVFTPPEASLAGIPTFTIGAAIVWYAIAYAVLYSYFIYFFINDLCISMRRTYAASLPTLITAPQGQRHPAFSLYPRGLARKLALIFLIIGVLPTLLIGLDLTVFSAIRRAQGLSDGQVIALDLIATLYVITASIAFVSRSLLAPTRELFKAQEAVQRGDLSYKAAVLTNDELGEVTMRFNLMVDALREREFMKTALHRYLSPQVATELIASGGTIESKSVEATVMFTDIAGFTSLSETLPPQETVDLLNAYFELLNSIVAQAGGTVNNFIGDAIVAVFNVPNTHNAHARAAIEAAIAIQAALSEKWFTLRDAAGQTVNVQLPTRIGINTGFVCAGTVGSSERQGYTVYGDAVNLSARIEPLNKQFNTKILIAESTANLASIQGFNADLLINKGEVSIVGRQARVVLFSVR